MSSDSFPSQARVVVIGGGVMGCSTLYHLAKLGIEDAVLLERQKLTCGTTWHSAAQVRQLRSSRNLTQLIKYSTELYAALEAETGQSTGWLRTGSLSIATNPDRLIHIRRQAALARAYDVPAEEVDVGEVRRLWPLAETGDVIGAVYAPEDGRVNPSDLCLALIKGARARGADVHEDTAVTGFVIENDRLVGIETSRGRIACEAAVIAAGLWSRDLALKAGVAAPLLPCEHFYLLTKPIEGIEGHLPTLSDHDSYLYIRDDVGGLLVGCFEPMGKPLEPAALGESFAFSLLPEDWDHFEPMMLNALHRIPALETAEVRTLLNGPESFTPDGSFMLGESAELRRLYLCCGFNSVGVATGGGAGRAIAEWVAGDAAPMDLHEADPRRFCTAENALEALRARAPEVLGKHYVVAYPEQEWRSARDLRRTPLHERFAAAGAYFGPRFGWERPLWFGAEGEPALTFGRPAWFEAVGGEVAAAHEAAALFDLSTYGKIRVRGADAESFLQRLCANDMARPPGQVTYTALLNERGGFESDLTALRLDRDDYRLIVGTNAIRRDLSWLRRHLRTDERVTLEDETESFAVLGLMGPHAREVVAGLGGEALDGLGYFRHRAVTLARLPVTAARMSYVGEFGWELSVASRYALELADALMTAGRKLGLRYAGANAQTAMRIEKRYPSFGHDIGPDDTPLEAGLDFALKLEGDRDFIGKEALLAQRAAGLERRLVSILLDDSDAQPLGHEPLYRGETICGQVTSAGFGYRVGRPVALGMVQSPRDGEALALDVAGERFQGRVALAAVYDPEGARLRG